MSSLLLSNQPAPYIPNSRITAIKINNLQTTDPIWYSIPDIDISNLNIPNANFDHSTFSESLNSKAMDPESNKFSTISTTVTFKQPFFNHFKFILNGIFKQFLSNFTIEPNQIEPIPINLAIGSAYLIISTLKINKLNITKQAPTTLLLNDGFITLKVHDFYAGIEGTWRIQRTLDQKTSFLNGSIAADCDMNINGELIFYQKQDYTLGLVLENLNVPFTRLNLFVESFYIQPLIYIVEYVFKNLIMGSLSVLISSLLRDHWIGIVSNLFTKLLVLGDEKSINLGRESFSTLIIGNATCGFDGLILNAGLKLGRHR